MRVQMLALACAISSLSITTVPLSGISSYQQQSASTARKFMVIGNERAEVEMARLDAFVEELNKNAKLRGYLVIYTDGHSVPGHILRKVHGYLDRLINDRGISPDRVEIIKAGQRDEYATELWLVPNGELFSIRPEARKPINATLIFDRVLYGVGCEPEVSIDLYELEDGLKFWAKALAENPQAKGWIVVNPKRRSSRRNALRLANRTKNLLVRRYNIESQRLMTRVGIWQDDCSNVEFWIATEGMMLSRATPNNSFNASGISMDVIRKIECFSQFFPPR